jgi:hypothetical protein
VDDVRLFNIQDFREPFGGLPVPGVAQVPFQALQPRWLSIPAEWPVIIVDLEPVDADTLHVADRGTPRVMQADDGNLMVVAGKGLREQGHGNFSAPDDLRRIKRIDDEYSQGSPQVGSLPVREFHSPRETEGGGSRAICIDRQRVPMPNAGAAIGFGA